MLFKLIGGMNYVNGKMDKNIRFKIFFYFCIIY